MPSVTIDASVLATPRTHSSTEDVENYVNTLVDWGYLESFPIIKIYMMATALDALHISGQYPYYSVLKKLLKSHRIDFASVEDLDGVIRKLQNSIPHFEDQFKFRRVVLEQCIIQPDLMSIVSHDSLRQELEQSIVITAVLRSICKPPIEDHFLVVKPTIDTLQFDITALIALYEHSRQDIGGIPTIPDPFNGSVVVFDSFRNLIKDLNIVNLWSQASGLSEKRSVIVIKVFQKRIKSNKDPEWENIPKFRLHEAFPEQFDFLCKADDGRLANLIMDKIYVTLDIDPHSGERHELGVTKGGPQRIRGRDNAKAWRRDVNHDIHIHYWGCSDGTLEFAWVDHHDIMYIPE